MSPCSIQGTGINSAFLRTKNVVINTKIDNPIFFRNCFIYYEVNMSEYSP